MTRSKSGLNFKKAGAGGVSRYTGKKVKILLEIKAFFVAIIFLYNSFSYRL